MFSTERHAQFQCSMKFLAHINMSQQHYLGNKKPTFLACNPEQVYAVIWNFQKITIFFRTATPNSGNFPKFP